MHHDGAMTAINSNIHPSRNHTALQPRPTIVAFFSSSTPCPISSHCSNLRSTSLCPLSAPFSHISSTVLSRPLDSQPLQPYPLPNTSPRLSVRMNASAFRIAYGPWAVVTGASSGIGAEFARQLAVLGLNVVLVARRVDRLSQLAKSLQSTTGVQTLEIEADLTTNEGRNAVTSATENLDVGLLINNAGIEFHGEFVNADDDAIENLIHLNITAVAILARRFGARLATRGRGGILFVSSISAHGFPYLAVYAASKAFVSMLAITAGDELRRKGVTVMSLEPGLVHTEMTIPDPNEQDDSNNLMTAEVCVRDALHMFGRSVVYTPGFTLGVLKTVLLWFPRPFIIRKIADRIIAKWPQFLE